MFYVNVKEKAKPNPAKPVLKKQNESWRMQLVSAFIRKISAYATKVAKWALCYCRALSSLYSVVYSLGAQTGLTREPPSSRRALSHNVEQKSWWKSVFTALDITIWCYKQEEKSLSLNKVGRGAFSYFLLGPRWCIVTPLTVLMFKISTRNISKLTYFPQVIVRALWSHAILPWTCSRMSTYNNENGNMCITLAPPVSSIIYLEWELKWSQRWWKLKEL